MLVSTVFTILLTPLLLSLVRDLQQTLRGRREAPCGAAGVPAAATRSSDA